MTRTTPIATVETTQPITATALTTSECDFGVPSAACDLVLGACHPSPGAGGPCATCAFRVGTEANRTASTMQLARLCVEGFRPFDCHEQSQLCRGYIAALNVRGVPVDDDDRKWSEVARFSADLLGACIAAEKAADR